MRSIALKCAALCAVSLCLVSAVRAEPLITSWIGTPTATTKTGFFVLDFNDIGDNPETYTFGWYYEGKPSGADFADALTASLTGPTGFTVGRSESGFLTSLGYSGRVKDSKVEPNGYFSYWLGFDGTQWEGAQFGDQMVQVSDVPLYTFSEFTNKDELSGAPWHGWRWVNDYTTDTPLAPRTTIIPEASTLLFFGILGVPGALLIVRRAINS